MTGAVSFQCRYGPYSAQVLEACGDDGLLEVRFDDAIERWNIQLVERDEEGHLTYSGLVDARNRWGDAYWFVFEPQADPPVMTFWGDQVIERQDVSTPSF